MTFEKGSLILVDYTARIKDSDEVFETTIEDDAVKHSIYDPQAAYRPRLVSIGDMTYPVLQGFAEELAGAAVGEWVTIEVPPDKGFGQRNPKDVRMIPIRKLGDDAERASIGDTVEVDGKKGIVKFIGSGRVRMDYNHRYAGKTILYDANVTKLLASPEEKIGAILRDRLPKTHEDIPFDIQGGTVSIGIPREIMRTEGLQVMKHFVQADMFKFAPELEKIVFSEEHFNAAKPEPETSEPETSEPETSEPETSEPETSEPETSEPETSKPETPEP